MAVYTQVTHADAQAWLNNYDLGSLVRLEAIEQGIENTNYFLTTSQSIYVLTLFENRVRPEDVPFFMDLMSELAKQGLTVPKPQRQRSGQTHGLLCGRPATVISFLRGRGLAFAETHHMHQVGCLLAQLHLAGLDIASQTGLARENTHGRTSWRQMLSSCSGVNDAEIGDTNTILQDALEAQGHVEAHWPSAPADALPVGLIHADLFPDNVFFDGDEFSGVIDFYFACTDCLAYDLAITLLAWCFTSPNEAEPNKIGQNSADQSHRAIYRPELAAALIDGYQSKRRLSLTERQAFPTLLIGGTLRFLSSRLYDWEHTPKDALVVRKDPRPWHDRLRHVLERCTPEDYIPFAS